MDKLMNIDDTLGSAISMLVHRENTSGIRILYLKLEYVQKILTRPAINLINRNQLKTVMQQSYVQIGHRGIFL